MRYAQHLLEDIPQAHLVAVCRRNAKEGLHFAQRHNLQFYKDFRDLIADPRVEAVLVVTAPSLTLSIAREEKPLLIEKPLAIYAADAREIVESADARGIPLMTAQTLRYDATILKLKEIAPRIGKWKYLPLTARMEHREHSREDIQVWENRGVLLEMGIHLLDLARFLTGEEIQEVYCELDRIGPDAPENQVWIRLTTQSGLLCFLDVSRVSSHRVTRAEIVGEQGQACADWSTSMVHLTTPQSQREEYHLPKTHTLLSVLQDFFHAVKNHSPMPITGLDGQRAVELADACYESAAAGRPIRLP
jgi:predicted dehydrogenase